MKLRLRLPKNSALACAIGLLARREHGAIELAKKLAQKGYESAEIEQAIAACQAQEYQSDARFAESICRVRIHQGYGPLRIRQELNAKHIARGLIDAVLQAESSNWIEYAKLVWQKKYKASAALSFQQKQKQKQFLLYRGFSLEMIDDVFSVLA